MTEKTESRKLSPSKTELAGYSPEDEVAMQRMLDEGGVSTPEGSTAKTNEFEQKKLLILEILKLILKD